MKRVLSILLIICMLLSCAACGETQTSETEAEENSVPQEVAPVEEKLIVTEMYLTKQGIEKYYPGDVIISHGFGIKSILSVMVNGDIYRDYELQVDIDGIVTFKNGGGGVIIAENTSDGATWFTVKIEDYSFEFGWSNTGSIASKTNNNSYGETSTASLDQKETVEVNSYTQSVDTATAMQSKVYYNCNNPVQPVGIQWKVNPKSNDDYLNNLYYLIIAGKYTYVTSVEKYDWKMHASECKEYFAAHCDLMDNLPYEDCTFYFYAGELYLVCDGDNIIKGDAMVDNLYALRRKSADQYTSMHKRYSFTAKTDVLEILKRYLAESYSYAPSVVCGFNNVLDLENIESYGLIVCDSNGVEHVVSYVPLNGIEYIVEFTSSVKGIYKLSEIEAKLNLNANEQSLSCVRKEAQQGYFDTRLRPEYCDSIKTKTLPSGDAGFGVTYKELAKFYTGSEELTYNSNPTTQADHYNNLKFLLITAQWDYKDIKITGNNQYRWISEYIKNGPGENSNNDINKNLHTATRFDPLFAPFANGTGDVIVFFDGAGYHVSTGYMPISYLMQPTEYLREISEVYKLAKKKYNDFRAQGLITNTSTQYEIAQVYGNWFLSLGNVQIERGGTSSIYDGGRSTLDHIESYYTATPYAGLITRNAQCAGRSSTMVLLLRMEGISAYGISCGPETTNSRIGHVVPWMLLDGNEYIFEYVNKTGIVPIDKENLAVHKCGHLLQEYDYNLIHNIAGLEYSEESLLKTYIDGKGNALYH